MSLDDLDTLVSVAIRHTESLPVDCDIDACIEAWEQVAKYERMICDSSEFGSTQFLVALRGYIRAGLIVARARGIK